jgi:hypothetical protein
MLKRHRTRPVEFGTVLLGRMVDDAAVGGTPGDRLGERAGGSGDDEEVVDDFACDRDALGAGCGGRVVQGDGRDFIWNDAVKECVGGRGGCPAEAGASLLDVRDGAAAREIARSRGCRGEADALGVQGLVLLPRDT